MFNTYSKNVIFTGDSLCSCDTFSIKKGQTLDTILSTIYNEICTNESVCKVKISSTDDCCGYLFDKLTSSDNSVSFEKITDTETSCETLDISAPGLEIITNYTIETDVTLTAIGTFQTVSFPANTFKEIGEIIEIESYFHLNNEIWSGVLDPNVIKIEAGGMTIASNISFLNTWYSINIRANLTKIDARNVKGKLYIDVYDVDGVSVYSTLGIISGNIGTLANGFDISTKLTATDSGNASVTNVGISIKHFNKL